ncbi:SMI1/KNR4 family protein [Streptomyces shaanxiensis]|uniref:Knr4/Smi1-like domain-containing protein n=1 Tax=Streptomyces shaanxiensis TaxID=653357 RepID=A0ABP7W423_9ACTN
MWREIASEFQNIELQGPADEKSLNLIERQLDQIVPQSLRELLLETDGIAGRYGTDVIWSAGRILGDNLAFRNDEQFRSLYQPFDDLMFFGDNGGGDQFAFVRSRERDEIFVWDHETDSRIWVSGSLEHYLRKAIGSDGEDWYRG